MALVPVRCYTRVSTEEQALSGYSLSAQQEHLRQYVARREGWQCVGWYADEGISAKDTNRPGFRRMLDESRPGDVILVYKLDRLTRSVRDLDELLSLFERQRIMFQSVTEQFETTTASGRLFIRIVAELAQWERELIAERTSMGKRQKVQLGEWPGGPVPYGYTAVPSQRFKAGRPLLELVPDPQRAHLVAAIFHRYLSGYGLRAICIWLNDELGARTARGARWRVSSLVRLLTNPIYCGDVVHGRRTRGPVTRTRARHEPLVSRADFERVQEAFHDRKQAAPRHAAGPYPLAGIARCGVCGGRVGATKRRRPGSYAYRCASYMSGMGCGKGAQRPLASVCGRTVEASLVSAVAGLGRPAELSRFFAVCAAERAGEDWPNGQERSRLEADLAAAEGTLRRWDLAYETGGITYAEYLERIRPHRERRRILRAQLASLSIGPPPPPEVAVSGWPSDFSRAWAHLEPPERKALLRHFLRAFGSQILLFPNRRVELRPAKQPPPAGAPDIPAGRTHGPPPATPPSSAQTRRG